MTVGSRGVPHPVTVIKPQRTSRQRPGNATRGCGTATTAPDPDLRPRLRRIWPAVASGACIRWCHRPAARGLGPGLATDVAPDAAIHRRMAAGAARCNGGPRKRVLVTLRRSVVPGDARSGRGRTGYGAGVAYSSPYSSPCSSPYSPPAGGAGLADGVAGAADGAMVAAGTIGAADAPPAGAVHPTAHSATMAKAHER